ncbi:hypothetical protein X927_02225 [Petrotoga mexicana DSM 14811]|jgi:vacuolar-type H+-ATPase subunit E/Vma4|uniref:V-type proton ATPase subunit E n=1 Tax=Petrotoga mexicana DSM 14811 TaxID=1122954 RepID=A0A2K1PDK6_9BACT|nr:V-type ATP synthase subunit E family protein [Petrotoga mexicana]MDN5345635.1 hypothetical protein [Petrotoga sp.]PNS00818.1 hypothetical protein X927_02225 [Petrotoga mexicana DSM 14811]
MNEIEDKLESMLELLDKKFEQKCDELKISYNKKLEEVQKRIEEDINNYRDKKLKEAKEEADLTVKVSQSKAKLKIKQERLKLKNQLLESLLQLIKKDLVTLDPDNKKYFYQKLYIDATKLIHNDYEVLCNKNDYETVKSIVLDHNVKTSKEIEGGILLKSNNTIINNSIDSYVEQNKTKIFSLILEEVGDI